MIWHIFLSPIKFSEKKGPLSSIHLVLRLISTLLKLEISTLLKTITNSCFQALEGLKFQALEGLKFQALEGLKSNAQPDESNYREIKHSYLLASSPEVQEPRF